MSGYEGSPGWRGRSVWEGQKMGRKTQYRAKSEESAKQGACAHKIQSVDNAGQLLAETI